MFNDVRTLLNDEQLLEKGCLEAVKQYNKAQFVPVKVEGAEQPVWVLDSAHKFALFIDFDHGLQ